jgi:hypothetical protein
MLKKSLLLSIAVLLTAVIFIFTGCEGPAGPAGSDAANGDINFPGDITVSVPGSGTTPAAPSLPPGVTYPDQGAKILAGTAADISKAFNGGIFVANTPDSGEPYVGGANTGVTNDGTVYAQDAVDAVVWTGILDYGNPQGSIVVPPGKTLFIAAPLPVNAGAGYFQGITISDEGTYSSQSAANASILADTRGGTAIGENTPRGKIVILNGGSITGAGAQNIIVGGNLEIHRGGTLSVGGANFKATAGSVINTYGEIQGGATALTFNGELNVKGYGSVAGSAAADIFYGKITVESYGKFYLGTVADNTNFNGPIEVQENAEFILDDDLSADSPVTFYGNTAIAGTLTAYDNNVTVRETGHLDIAATGKIEANAWAQIRGYTASAIPQIQTGTDKTLFAAIAQGAVPGITNNYTTIKVPSDGLITLEFVNYLPVSTYENLRILAASDILSLPGGVSLVYDSGTPARILETRFTTAETDLSVKTNNVQLDHQEIGNVTVEAGKRLSLVGTVLKAGAIKVYGGLTAASATFTTGIDSLTIGPKPEDGRPVEVILEDALFGGPSSDPETPFNITVNEGSKLTLGDGANLTIDPQGVINLEKNAELYIDSVHTTNGMLDQLKGLHILEGAKFSINATGIPSFTQLQNLTVDGLLDVTASGVTTFANLQTNWDGSNDVSGGGTAIFENLAVTGATLNRAFEQLLAIRHLAVGTVAGIPKTSKTDTPDAADPPAGPYTEEKDRPTLTVTKITAPPTGLTINRDLIVVGTTSVIDFGTTNANKIVIEAGYKIKIADLIRPVLAVKEILSAGTGGAVLADDLAGAAVFASLTANHNDASFTVIGDSLDILAESSLNVAGTLTTGITAVNIFAGEGANRITLTGGTGTPSFLKNGSITTEEKTVADAPAKIAVNRNGTLKVLAASTVAKGSSIEVSRGGTIDSTGTTLTFGTAGLVAVGTFTGGGETPAGIAADDTDGDATITGDLVAMTGAEALKITTATNKLTITGSVSTRNLGTAYNSVKLAGSVISGTGTATFDASAGSPSITFTNKLTGGSNGSLTTSLTGKLIMGTIITLTGDGQSLSGVTLDGTALSVTGNLSLTGTTTLAIGATALNIGAAGASGSGTLAVNGGKITLAGIGSSIVLLKDDGTGQIGNFVLGATPGTNNYLKGLTTAADATALATYGVSGAGAYVADNITIAGTGAGGSGTATNTATVTVGTGTPPAGQVTITGGSTGNTITSESGIYRL